MSNDIFNLYWKRRYKRYFYREILEHKILKDRFGFEIKKTKLFCGKKLPNAEETNNIIYEKIVSGKPFAMVRPGNAEFSFAVEWEEKKLFGKKLYNRKANNWENNIRTYGNRTDEYNYMFRRDIAESDIFSVFPDAILEEYLAERYAQNSQIISMSKMPPFEVKKPWTDALVGKKVLVVSIFAEYLKEQYEKREKLYMGEWKLPEFELIPVKSVWYYNGENSQFSSWFDALDYLYKEIMKHDFDIAILSCGPFAINLAPMIKRMGKQAIQYAGETQLLFGIRGQRWDDIPFFKKYYNESWIRVSPEESGISNNSSKQFDAGCYW